MIRFAGLILGSLFLATTAWAWKGTFDIPSLCADAGWQGVWDLTAIGQHESDFPGKEIQTGSTEEIVAAVNRYCDITQVPECLRFAPWELLNAPRLETRLAAHWSQLKLAEAFLKSRGYGSDAMAELERSLERNAVYSPWATGLVRATLTEASRFHDFKRKFEEARALAPLLCAPLGEFHCVAALRDALTLGQVARLPSQALLTLVPAVERVLTDPAHLHGAPLAALRIQKRVEETLTGHPPSGDLFSDLISAYRDAGYSESRAEDLVFDFLAFYGTRGASVDYVTELANSENYPVLLALYVISSATGVLDVASSRGGHPYSYPASIYTKCSYGRPYHFWLAAALAHELVKRGHGALAAFRATHLTGVGYEALANTDTRTNWAPLAMDPDDYELDEMRANLIFDDAGARFGADFAARRTIETIDLDTRHGLLYRAARWEDRLPPARARRLYRDFLPGFVVRWWKLFAPDAGIRDWDPR